MSLSVLNILAIIVIGVGILFVWSFWRKDHDVTMLLYLMAIMLAITIFFVRVIYKAYVKESIEDGCWVYLRGQVYCPSCQVKHSISSICAEQIWDGGTSDEGWQAYVFAERFKDGSYHDSFGFNLTLHNHHVVKMKYDPTIHPITGE